MFDSQACESIREAWAGLKREGGAVPVGEAHQGGVSKARLRARIESSDFLENAARLQHEQWVKQNKRFAWVDPKQLLPYAELDEDSRDKNRAIVRCAVEVYAREQLAVDS